jgi:hypothetical protein
MPWAGAAVGAALVLCSPLREVLEASMPLHMLVEFPVLVFIGVALARLVPQPWPAGDWWDAGGLTSAVIVTATFAIWMVPSQLDMSLIDGRYATFKYASWVLAGAATARGLSIWRTEVAGFILGSVGWMTASVGMLYQELPQRLCVNYLIDGQVVAGEGLVVVALLVGVLVVLRCVGWPNPHRLSRRPT